MSCLTIKTKLLRPLFKMSLNSPSKVDKGIYRSSIACFTLYIPQRKLSLVKKKGYGNVYPVYIADEKYLNESNPNRLLPLLSALTGLNLYFVLAGLKNVPFLKIYSYAVYSEPTMMISLIANILVMRKFFNITSDHSKRVKALYLKENGIDLIMETFSGITHKLDCNDIYERRYEFKYKSKAIQLLTTNHNSYSAYIKWGNDKESIFTGRTKYVDHEILEIILNRHTIDTTQSMYKPGPSYMNSYTDEEKKKAIKYIRSKIFLPRLNFQRIGDYYKYFHAKLRLRQEKRKDFYKPKSNFKNKTTKLEDKRFSKKVQLRYEGEENKESTLV